MTVQDRKEKLDLKPQTIKFYESLLVASTDGIVITDNMQNILVANKAFCSFIGQDYGNVVETSLLEWLSQYSDDGLSAWSELDKEVCLRGLCQNIEFCIMLIKEKRYFNVNASVLERTDKEVTSIISIWRDVTDHKQTEKKLNDYRDLLEDKVKERTTDLSRANARLKEKNKELEHFNELFVDREFRVKNPPAEQVALGPTPIRGLTFVHS